MLPVVGPLSAVGSAAIPVADLAPIAAPETHLFATNETLKIAQYILCHAPQRLSYNPELRHISVDQHKPSGNFTEGCTNTTISGTLIGSNNPSEFNFAGTVAARRVECVAANEPFAPGTVAANSLSADSSLKSAQSTQPERFGSSGELFADFALYSEPDWDGYGAKPISAETMNAARELLRLLPNDAPEPDVAPSGEGVIGFEWLEPSELIRKIYVDVGPGLVFRAYRRLANGTVRHVPLQLIAPQSALTLTFLFHPQV